MINRKCPWCDLAFQVPWPSHAKKYCSQACSADARRLPVVKGLYRSVYVPVDHPLSNGHCKIQVHRLVLWEKIGPGAHPCSYCGITVRWMPGAGPRRGALVADHVDRDPTNNDPANIVASCQPCNMRNSARMVADNEPHRVTTKGTRRRCISRSCRHCGADFLAYRSKDPTRGRYCSRSCIAKDKPRRRQERAA